MASLVSGGISMYAVTFFPGFAGCYNHVHPETTIRDYQFWTHAKE